VGGVSVVGLREQLLVIAGAAPSGHFLHFRMQLAGRFVNAFRPIAALDDLVLEIPCVGQMQTVYLACAPRARRQGGRDRVERVECLWADCDTDEALAARARFEPAPSLDIASGGLTASGQDKLHSYWRLAMRVDAETADVALRRLQRHLGSDPQCAEAARVLRPIGSTWRKDGLVRPVELVHVDLRAVYPIEDILDGTEPLPTPERRRATAAAPAVPDVHHDGHGIDYAALGGDSLDALAAALKAVPPAVYVAALTGREPNRAGKICCPFHEDWNPSFHVYPTADQGWACFQCDTGQGRVVGGSIVDLGARLYGMDPRREYPALLRRLAHDLLGDES
jgi:hypothetical protein